MHDKTGWGYIVELWQLGVIVGAIVGCTAVFIVVVVRAANRQHGGPPKHAVTQTGVQDTLVEQAKEDVEHIFNDTFREELRNRGRLHFEKIIGENAMFLQQDLRLTTSQVNEYMKDEITRKLKDEFAKYEESIADAKQLAIDSISKTQEALEQQRQVMSQQLAKELAEEKQRLLQRFEDNMADIVNHYVLAAIGDQIDLNDQLEYILADIVENREAIVADIKGGA